jgi:hypothetical protein
LAAGILPSSRAYSKHEALGKDMVKILTDLTDVLESVQDRDSARAAAVRIQQICDRMEELERREQFLPAIRRSEAARLKEQWERELKPVKDRLNQAIMRAGLNSGGEPSYMAACVRFDQIKDRLANQRR